MLKKLFNIFSLLLVIIFIFPSIILAHDYVLPYPSYMPGNKLYKVSRIVDTIQNYWYWGSISQEKYHLGLSDKYLVEAKTLFEYKQYLLGVDALKRSNNEFLKVRPNIDTARKEGKDMTEITDIFIEAEEAHEEVLDGIKQRVPVEFNWTPEKTQSTNLLLHALINESVTLRQKEIQKI